VFSFLPITGCRCSNQSISPAGRPTAANLQQTTRGQTDRWIDRWMDNVLLHWPWPAYYVLKGKGSPYSITECSVPELIPVLDSQPAGDVSHKPGGRLPLLSARPTVTPATLKRAATNFTAWWTEWRVTGVNSLPKTVTRQCCGCDLNPGPTASESSMLTIRLPSHPMWAVPKSNHQDSAVSS